MKKVLIPEAIADSGVQYLMERGYQIRMGIPTDPDNLKKEILDADGLIVRNTRYPREVFEQAPRLKVIARHGVGVDNIDVKAAEELGIWCVNGPGSNANAVAEYTMAMILSLSCGLLQSDRFTRNRDWSFRLEQLRRHELSGHILGVIGLGRIGRLVAQKASAGFGMKVIAYTAETDLEKIPGVELKASLEEVAAQADFLSLHLPSSEETRNLFDERMFRRMKKGAFFINCARGDLYVEEDLARVIKEGHLAGAALDVYREEPLGESPLYELPQVILSQHCAGFSEESKENMALYAAIGVDEVLTGRRPSWPVNNPK